jgi:glycosyltransferase involved in cell wall biosynthesis
MKPTILFIAHQASRTGAPLLLLNTIKWIKANANFNILILIAESGVLLPEFEQLGKVFKYPVEQKHTPNLVAKFFHRLFYKLIIKKVQLNRLKTKLKQNQINLIFSSTLSNGYLLDYLKFINAKVITHAHELEFLIKIYGNTNIKQVLAHTNFFICGSHSIQSNLFEKHLVPIDKSKTIHSFVPNIAFETNTNEVEDIRKRLNITNENMVVGFSATLGWLKGTDLLIQIAAKVLKNNPNIVFVWVGANKQSFDYLQYQYEIDREKLSDKIVFIESVANPANYYAVFDIFVFPSREDSFGLVGLENALFETPIVCFDRGGQPEFVGNDCGFVVPYLDTNLMAEKIIMLANNQALRQELGKNAKNKVLAEFIIDVQMPKILHEINRIITS